MSDDLNAKQQRFADEYLVDLNATAAYHRAGYTAKGRAAEVNASRLLSDARVQARIAQRQKAREIRTEITQDRVLRELAAVGFAQTSEAARVVSRQVMEPILDAEGNVVGEQPVERQFVEIVDTDQVPADTRTAIASIKRGRNGIEVQMHDKIKALELLGRHLGMFTDKVKLEGDADNPLQVLFNIPRPPKPPSSE